MLNTETNTPEMEDRIKEAAETAIGGEHENLEVVFEHGQHWINCAACGAQWSVNDCVGGHGIEGFDFERVSDGDYSCGGN